MASGLTPKFRLVRCPNCRLVLPEVADVPVYKCGGCETILVAKKRNAVSNSTSVLQETQPAPSNKEVHVSEHGESSSSTPGEVLPSPSECHVSQESGGNQNISSDYHDENDGANLSIEGEHDDHCEKDQYTSSDSESDCDKLKVNRSRGGRQKVETQAALSNKRAYASEHGESSSSTSQELLPSSSTSQELLPSSSTSQELLSSRSTSQELPPSPECHWSRESGGNQNITGDYHDEKHGENLSNEGQNSVHYKKDHYTSSDSDSDSDKLVVNRSKKGQQICNLQQSGVSIEGSLSPELHHENNELMMLGEGNLEPEANYKVVQLEGENSELETNNKSGSNISGSSIDNRLDTRQISSTVTACAAAGEVDTSDNLVSSPDEQLGQPQKSEHHGFGRVRSTDTFETVDYASPSSELSGPFEYLSKSTTVRSSHAYDGSISSFDGMDDHFHDQQVHSLKIKYNYANYLVPEERHRRDKLPAQGMMNGNFGMRDHATNFSSDLSYEKHYAAKKYSKLHQDELLEPVMHRRPPRNWPRLERDEYPSQVPISLRASLRGYGSAGPSSELHDGYPLDSAFHPLEKAEYSEQENMKLLRMVHELQDQISKTCHLNGKPNRRNSTDEPWRQKPLPAYYYQEPHGEENHYPRYHGRQGQRSSWSQQSRFSRIPFSGGAINTRDHIENSCLCCHPQDWQRSEQLRPPILRHNRGLCRAHPGHSCYNSYSSCPSSPQRYMESDYSMWSRETQSDDQRYKDHELKRYLREKHHSVRRHLRPMAGGAPFVTCYHCFRPLQLPADFLLFKRKFHQLRCGACSKVLKFSLKKGMHIVPYEQAAAEPPPSEVGDYGDVINVRSSTPASCSHGCLQADPVSYSDDYGNSFCKSCSTDGDPVSHAQFHDLQGNAGVRNMAYTSSRPMEQSQNIPTRTEELPPRTGGSPLHRLMGYSSPSEVIN
ncbi:hypothetical protein COLO4_19477 [Corchorus olitorius]|uniref:Uncharacterized protein n=1 Tax=Corchorus olitorius TaxID=93759 RepID=A0A1R3J554_9ROSI|nr:hypothetical protein COLO4_19477 [Corchorus olitorius]